MSTESRTYRCLKCGRWVLNPHPHHCDFGASTPPATTPTMFAPSTPRRNPLQPDEFLGTYGVEDLKADLRPTTAEQEGGEMESDAKWRALAAAGKTINALRHELSDANRQIKLRERICDRRYCRFTLEDVAFLRRAADFFEGASTDNAPGKFSDLADRMERHVIAANVQHTQTEGEGS